MQVQDGSGIVAVRFFVVAVEPKSQRGPIHSTGGFDNVREVSLTGCVVKV